MEKSFWQKFNPSLKEMTEEKPNLTILGIWWAMYWRLIALAIAISLIVVILGKLFS